MLQFRHRTKSHILLHHVASATDPKQSQTRRQIRGTHPQLRCVHRAQCACIHSATRSTSAAFTPETGRLLLRKKSCRPNAKKIDVVSIWIVRVKRGGRAHLELVDAQLVVTERASAHGAGGSSRRRTHLRHRPGLVLAPDLRFVDAHGLPSRTDRPPRQSTRSGQIVSQ